MGRFSKLETQILPSGTPAEDPRARVQPKKEEPSPFGRAEAEPTYDAPGYMARGDESFFSGDPKQALRWYSRAMEVDNHCVDAWVAQIQVLILTGQLNEAKVWINRALSIFPDAPALLALRAVGHARSGMMRQAMASSDLILSKRGDDVIPWIARGHILMIDGNKNAEFCFDQCMRLSRETDWQVPFYLGLICEGERHWAKAIPHYEAALGRRSTLPYAWLRISKCHAVMGQREAAGRALRRAEDLCKDNPKLLHEIKTSSSGSIFGFLRRVFGR